MNNTRSLRGIDRRAFVGGAGTAALLAALAGCTGGGGGGSGKELSQPKGNVPAQYKDRVRVVAWTQWGGVNGETFASLVKKFNASQKDVYLDSQVQNGSYDDLAQKLATSMQAGQAPDLFTLSADLVGGFFLNGILEPLDDYFGSSIDVFNKTVIESSKISGSLWRLPFAGSTTVLFYNKEIFTQAGLPDRAPKTWKEFGEWARQVKGMSYNGSQSKMIAYANANGDYPFQNVLWDFGGAFSDGLDVKLDTADSIAAGDFVRDLVHGTQMAYMSTNVVNDFSNGLVATAHESSAILGSVLSAAKFEVGAGPSPAGEENQVPCGGGGLSITARAPKERKKAAATFLKFLSKPENAAFWSVGTGYMPIVDSARKQPVYQQKVAKYPQYDVAPRELDNVRRQDDIRMFVNTASDTIMKGLQKIYTTTATTKEVFSATAAELRKDAKSIKPEFDKKVHFK